jgi:MFS family permease
VSDSLITGFAFIGGSVVNKMGPRLTLMIGASGFPVYIGALWFLDRGEGVSFAYFGAAYHGISGALFYPAAGYVASAYSRESERGRYIGFSYMASAAGSVIGASIVLAITASRDPHKHGVPSSVYTAIICIQSFGVIVAALLVDPKTVIRNDGRAIARFTNLTWKEELQGLVAALLNPRMLLLALALFSAKTPYPFSGSLNATYYSRRTRSLANVS